MSKDIDDNTFTLELVRLYGIIEKMFRRMK